MCQRWGLKLLVRERTLGVGSALLLLIVASLVFLSLLFAIRAVLLSLAGAALRC
jgi:hypothetical protein